MSLSQELGQLTGHMTKKSGYWSELAANLNPLNIVGSPVGALSALTTPTRTLDEQSTADQDTWENFLIPGHGAYNEAKRIGSVMRGPEIKKIRAELILERLKEELALAEGAEGAVEDVDKEAGWKADLAGGILNPGNWYGGNALGSLAALATPTKSLRGLAESDESILSSLLIPGVGPYRASKRLGTAIRGPELKGKSVAKRLALAEAALAQLAAQTDDSEESEESEE